MVMLITYLRAPFATLLRLSFAVVKYNLPDQTKKYDKQ